VTKTENIVFGGYRRVCWELDDDELLLCTVHPWGNPVSVWVSEATFEEVSGEFTRFTLAGGQEIREAIIPFGSMVVFGETAL
jgi:hypothetical protein